MAKNLTPNQKRCEDCACLILTNGKWTCDECFGQSVEEIDDCPEGITLEQINEIDNTKIKTNLGAKNQKTTENKPKTPKTVKISKEKVELFDFLWEGISNFYENAEIIKNNKLIQVKIGEKTFKIDIIEGRQPK